MIVKKILKGLGWLIVAAVAFMAALTAYFYIGGIEWGDWTIPDENELRFEKVEVPDEDNAYVALMALTNLYHVSDADRETAKGDSLKTMSDRDFVRYYGLTYVRDDSAEREASAAVRHDAGSARRAERILANRNSRPKTATGTN